MNVARPLAKRPGEVLEDGRRWSFGEPEFSSAIAMMTVTPSELDVMELGMRAARSYAEAWTDDVQRRAIRECRMLHPVEWVAS